MSIWPNAIFYPDSLEAKYDERLRELKAKHEQELSALTPTESSAVEEPPVLSQNEDQAEDQDDKKSSKADKARRKREKAREKELQREREIQEETANAGPSQKDLEMELLLQKLTPLNLTIEDVTADGHCLYRAVAKACGKEYTDMRTYWHFFIGYGYVKKVRLT